MGAELVFWFKQIVGGLLMPSSLLFILIISSLALLMRGRIKQAKRTLGATVVLMYLCSTGMVGGHLLGYWEHQYQPLKEPENLDYIVVLGGYHNLARGEVLTNALGSSSARRLIETFRLAQKVPTAKVVFSGGMPDKFGKSHADYMAQIAIQLGMNPNRVLTSDETFDTGDEARRFLQGYAQGSKQPSFALISDASHMPRAMRLFEAQGLNPTAAPCNYKTATHTNWWSRHSFWPRASHLVNLHTAWYETMGNIWVWLSLNLFPLDS